MATSRSARRYAKAIFDLAQDSGSLDAVQADLAGVSRLLDNSPELASFVANPLISAERQVTALQAMFGDRADALTMRLLTFIVAKGRLDQLAGICGEFAIMYDNFKGILRVRATSACALTAPQVEAIKDRLGQKYGKHIELELEVDASLIGGFRLRVGDSVHDASVETQLARFKKQLINA